MYLLNSAKKFVETSFSANIFQKALIPLGVKGACHMGLIRRGLRKWPKEPGPKGPKPKRSGPKGPRPKSMY